MLLYLFMDGASKLDYTNAALSMLCYIGVWAEVKAACFAALDGTLAGFTASVKWSVLFLRLGLIIISD